MPTDTAGLPRLLFLIWPLRLLMKQTRQAVHAIKQSILLRCPWCGWTAVRATAATKKLIFEKDSIVKPSFSQENNITM